MGLDDFRTGDDNNNDGDNSDTDSGDNRRDSTDSTDIESDSGENVVQEKIKSDKDNDGNEETTSEDEPSGLESFKTHNTPTGSGDGNGLDSQNELTFGIPPSEWNQMSKSERVKRVRDGEIEDYHPDYKPEGGWKYVEVAKVKCVCDATLTVAHTSVCGDCGRVYKKTNRTVIKKPDTDKNNEY